MEKKDVAGSIDEYIAQFDPAIQTKLNQMRKTIQEAAPEATEKMSYQMPTFYYFGNLVHFAAFDKHIGFYPQPRGIEEFSEALSRYKTGKGSVQFPIDQPLPLELVAAMVKYRMTENISKQEERKRR